MNNYSQMKYDNKNSSIKYIDYRSDTFTKPSLEMKQAAMDCLLGDDVYEEDPTAIALQEKMAKMLGKEAALFTSTGTQGNLIAMLCHCARGEEVIAGDRYHIYSDEAKGASVLGGIAMDPLKTDQFGSINIDDFLGAIKQDDVHYAISKLLCLENTVSGCVQNQDHIDALAKAAHDHDIKVHLDGARLFNAAAAQDVAISSLVKNIDTISICLSKGIGAPAGNVLIGSKEFIHNARRQRKLLGGGMRQVGILAACGIYGLDHNVPLLKEDHRRARRLAEELAKLPQISINLDLVQTNMLFIEPDANDRESLRHFLYERNIIIGAPNPTARTVVHLDISDDDIDHTIKSFKEFYSN